jgi:hypothetical protein
MTGMAAVEFAAYFVAIQRGGAERILQRHRPTPNGLCAGCLATPTTHPCQAARIAEAARRWRGGPMDPRRPDLPPRS